MNLLNLIAANVLLSWIGVSDATGYKIYAGEKSGQYSQVIDVGNLESCSLRNIPDTVRFFAVTAYNSIGESQKSSEVILSASPTPTPTPSPTATPVQTPGCDPVLFAKLQSDYQNCELNNFQMYNAWQGIS